MSAVQAVVLGVLWIATSAGALVEARAPHVPERVWEQSGARVVFVVAEWRKDRRLNPHRVSEMRQLARTLRREIGSVSSGEHELDDLSEPVQRGVPLP